MSDSYVLSALRTNELMNPEEEKEVKKLIEEKVIDPVIVHSILTMGKKENRASESAEMLKSYYEECLHKVNKHDVKVDYDLTDLSKTNIFALIARREVNLSEKYNIKLRGKIAQRHGIGDYIGQEKETLVSKIISKITRTPQISMPITRIEYNEKGEVTNVDIPDDVMDAAYAYNTKMDLDKEGINDAFKDSIKVKRYRYENLKNMSESDMSDIEKEERDSLGQELKDNEKAWSQMLRKNEEFNHTMDSMNMGTRREYNELANSQKKQEEEEER